MDREEIGPPVASGRPQGEGVAKREPNIPAGGAGPTAGSGDRLAAFRADGAVAFDVYFVRSGDEAAEMLLAASVGHPLALPLFGALRLWFGSTPSDRRVCLCCGRAVAAQPAGFAFVVPHRTDPADVVVAPMCARCCGRSNDDAMRAATVTLRAVWPDLREVTGDGGNA